MRTQFRASSDRFIASMRHLGADLAYDRESVRWIDGFIERNRGTFGEVQAERLVELFGTFLGECLISAYGGAWCYCDERDEWGVTFDDTGTAFPATKVSKQLRNGEEDSIASFFDVVGAVVYQAGVGNLAEVVDLR